MQPANDDAIRPDIDLGLYAYLQSKAYVESVDRMRGDDPEYLRTVGSDRYQRAVEAVGEYTQKGRAPVSGSGLTDKQVKALKNAAQSDPESDAAAEASANGTSPKAAKRSKEPRDCQCGCGGQTKGGRFLPGHDAKFHAAEKRKAAEAAAGSK